MKVSMTDNNINLKGLYFTKSSNLLFNKKQSISNKISSDVKTLESGIRYLEDSTIPKAIKERFMEIPFIKELAEKFDTFVFFRELPKEHKNNIGKICNIAFAKISWADFSKMGVEVREVEGFSPISQQLATDKMFKNLEKQNFSTIS